MPILWFSLASLVTFVLASATSVFLLGQVEHAGGRWGSFQVLCMLSLVGTFMLLLGFGVMGAVLQRWPRRAQAAALGAGSALLFLAVIWVSTTLQAKPAESWALLFLLPFFGGLSQFMRARENTLPPQ